MKISELKCEVCGSKVELYHKVFDDKKRRVLRTSYCTICDWCKMFKVQKVKVCKKTEKFIKE